ncbi:MAG: hypothetical protein JRI68_17865 [Deltaproteobacteria bacterium]|nr:hypothetical protein [Deltaproteobacteria bacterium]
MVGRWWAVLLVVAVGCGGSDLTPAAPPTATAANRCPDWVNQPSGGVTWEPHSEADEIQTFTGQVPGSDFVAFKGAGPIDAPIAKVANVLIDTPRHGEWVPSFGGMRIVRDLSENEKVIYRHVLTPFVIDDRDFVVKVLVHEDEAYGHLLFDFSSVEDPDAPVIDGKVRGMLHSSGYRMWPIEGGARTMVIFTIHADPKGDVPAWIVNLFQNGYARTNLENIRAQAAKADVAAHPRIQEEFRDFTPKCDD